MVNIGIRHFRPAFGIVQPRISWVLIGTGVESQNTQFRLVSCQCGGRQFGHITVRHANCRSFNLTTQYILITPKTTESLHTTQPDFSFVLPFRASPGCGRQGRARGCDVTPTSRIAYGKAADIDVNRLRSHPYYRSPRLHTYPPTGHSPAPGSEAQPTTGTAGTE